MDVDGAVEDVVVAVAGFIEEGLAGFDAALGLREAREEVELDGREDEGLGAEDGGAGVEVEAEFADDDFLGRRDGLGGDGGVERAAAEDGAEAREKFAGGKRFREIVVGTDFEADDAVGLVAPRGEHEDGDGGFLADTFEDLEAVHAGEHNVEDQRVPRRGAGGGGALDAFGTGVDGGDVEAERFKVGGDEATEFFVVVDHQQARAAGVGSVGGHGRRVWAGVRPMCNRRDLNLSLTIRPRPAHIDLTCRPQSRPMRLVLLAFFLAARMGAAELTVEFQLRWRGAPLALPSAELAGVDGQALRMTRFAALVSGFVLTRGDGGSVRLDGQHGFIDAETGRLLVSLHNVPAGDYTGIAFQVGVPPAQNRGDPAQWPAGHPLNPIVNGLHWGWSGGYVFAAIEGRWRAATVGEERGFSYHLATDGRLMRVGFATGLKVSGATRVRVALDLGKVLGGHRLAADDGSESTHSGNDDALAVTLAHAMERAWFFLEAGPVPATGPERERVESATEPLGHARSYEATESGRKAPPANGTTPLAFAVPAGFPQPELPADNPLTEEGVELGRRLFGDRRLSAGRTQSCTTCHHAEAGFAETRAVSIGADGKPGTRNSMPLFNLAWNPAYAWDGSKPRLRDQAHAALTGELEMHADAATVAAELARDPRVRDDFAAAFGTREVTPERIGLALEQFMLTLVAADSKFDRSLRGAAVLTEQEQEGFALFVTEYDPVRGKRGADCFHCHGGALFSDYGFKNNGLDLVSVDAGRAVATGRKQDEGKFKTPSLRNVAATAPYMHDGRFATLGDVVAHYDHGVKRAVTLDPNLAKHPDAGLGLTKTEQAALVAFLHTLTDEK